MDIATVVARVEIQDLLVRYCRGVDRADIDLVKSVYHAGAKDNHGVFNGDASEFAEYAVPLLASTYSCTQHQLSNMTIDIQREHASAETYFVAYHSYRSAEVDRLTIFGGRYLDQFELRAGRWGIVDRKVVHDFSDDREVGTYEHVSVFPQGARGSQDKSSQLFAQGRRST